MEESNIWKKCSTCKKPIALSSKYFVCSVSTCNSKRTGYSFCSVSCFEVHVPGARHKNAAAVEETAPKEQEVQKVEKPQRRLTRPNQLSAPSNKQVSKGGDVLIIASRFKDFISEQADFNTSASVMNALSDHIRHVAMQAIDNARADSRKTVMEQDIKFLDKLNLNI